MQYIMTPWTNKWIPEPNSGCHLWIAATDGDEAYGLFWYNGSLQPAHRVAWQMAHGPILLPLQVLHKCDVSLCVNEQHLYLGNQKKNMQDMIERHRYKLHMKLSRDEITKIENDTRPQKTIAAEYNITQGYVSRIKKLGLKIRKVPI